MSGAKRKGSPLWAARVSLPEANHRLEELRREYSRPNGRIAARTDVVLALLIDGLPLMDAELRGRARALALNGEPLAETWRRVVKAGLDALERT